MCQIRMLSFLISIAKQYMDIMLTMRKLGCSLNFYFRLTLGEKMEIRKICKSSSFFIETTFLSCWLELMWVSCWEIVVVTVLVASCHLCIFLLIPSVVVPKRFRSLLSFDDRWIQRCYINWVTSCNRSRHVND